MQPKLSQLILSLVALFSSAIQTHRTDQDTIAQQKADADKHVADLEAQLKQAQEVDGDIESVRGAVTDALTQAQAAKPPTQDQVEEVADIPVATTAPASDAPPTA